MYHYFLLNLKVGGTPILIRKHKTLGEVNHEDAKSILKTKSPNTPVPKSDYTLNPINAEEVMEYHNHELVTFAPADLLTA
jgi:hypothetical protein